MMMKRTGRAFAKAGGARAGDDRGSAAAADDSDDDLFVDEHDDEFEARICSGHCSQVHDVVRASRRVGSLAAAPAPAPAPVSTAHGFL